ncbi:hypothetical protein CYMTET_47764 [Cymbomonas tetramitiformis]|uniref:Uncharacterized protein n=1 Tax=Cymbomonas tetramitiformis TaxID=36881 RepID=A0AAE0EXG2_9CHLO|nr:hypothetical protein CYMTET_47764 [Cymbomonas tetramitiformis]
MGVQRHMYDMILEVDVDEMEDDYATVNTIYQRSDMNVMERTDKPEFNIRKYKLRKLFLRITKFPQTSCPGIMIPPVDLGLTTGPWFDSVPKVRDELFNIQEVNHNAIMYTHVDAIHVHDKSANIEFNVQNLFSNQSWSAVQMTDLYNSRLSLLNPDFGTFDGWESKRKKKEEEKM